MFEVYIDLCSADEAVRRIDRELEKGNATRVSFLIGGNEICSHLFMAGESPKKYVEYLYKRIDDSKKENKRYKHGAIECIDALRSCLSEEEFRGFCKGNIIKYLWRSEYKGGKVDFSKARDYLDYLLKEESSCQ